MVNGRLTDDGEGGSMMPSLVDGPRADASTFMKIELFQIRLKRGRPNEPRFQTSSVWCATGNKKRPRGRGEREAM
jgi:hypothetical protein